MHVNFTVSIPYWLEALLTHQRLRVDGCSGLPRDENLDCHIRMILSCGILLTLSLSLIFISPPLPPLPFPPSRHDAVPDAPFSLRCECVDTPAASKIEAHIYFLCKTAPLTASTMQLDVVKKYQDSVIQWWHRFLALLLFPLLFMSALSLCVPVCSPVRLLRPHASLYLHLRVFIWVFLQRARSDADSGHGRWHSTVLSRCLALPVPIPPYSASA